MSFQFGVSPPISNDTNLVLIGEYDQESNKRRNGIQSEGRLEVKNSCSHNGYSLWSYYTKIDRELVKCEECWKVFKTKNSTTTVLHNHLKRKHMDKYATIMQNGLQRRTQNTLLERQLSDDTKTCCVQTESKRLKYGEYSLEQLSTDMEIVKFLKTTNHPVSLVEDPGFIEFVEALHPNCTVKSTAHYEYVNNIIAYIKRLLKDADSSKNCVCQGERSQ